MGRTRTLILGAAGRDFHNFNVVYRDDPDTEVVGFTAEQIPGIDERTYPPELAGELYPDGITIYPESRLEELIDELDVERCIMAYSDVSYEYTMGLGARVNAAGAEFAMMGAKQTMLQSSKPVVAVCASRTGAGKSQTSRAVVRLLRDAGRQVAVIRHPMPYGDLAAQRVQRFETEDDLVRHNVTIEEREEYEPHLAAGSVVFAGVDYEAILREAEKEADVILWDGGNNDFAFYRPDVYITLVDPHRAGHELSYYPGEINVRLADAILVNKIGTAAMEDVFTVERNARSVNPDATLVEAASPLFIDDADALRGKRVLCIEDGPTLTHGGMQYGAAVIGAQKAGAAEIIDPREFAVGEIAGTYEKYPEIGELLPAMGYGEQQIADLQETINRAVEGGVEAIAIGTPIDLARLVELPVPATRIRYELQVLGSPTLEDVLAPVLKG
ncbi:MAG: cyclic 2,3-diphosphoglycerate synthase [Candidatus Longimicrobiales bacterium M2_2A_002]